MTTDSAYLEKLTLEYTRALESVADQLSFGGSTRAPAVLTTRFPPAQHAGEKTCDTSRW